MKKCELKNGMIVQTTHNRYGVVELDRNRIDFCYDPCLIEEYKCLEKVSLEDVFEFDDGKLGIGFILDKEHKNKYLDFYKDFEVGDLVICYEIVAIYELKNIYNNRIGPFPSIIIK